MRRSTICQILMLLAVFATFGCESGLKNFKLPGIPTAGELRAKEREAARHREEFRQSRSRKSIRWLLANMVRQGMSLSDVEEQIGEQGELVDNAAYMKERNHTVRLTDQTVKWGEYVLFFRDDRLVNHNPAEYR